MHGSLTVMEGIMEFLINKTLGGRQMGHSRFVAIGVMALMFTAAGRAGELKVGFINSQEIFRDYKGTEDAQRKFDQEKQKLEQELEGKKQELDELRADLEKRSLLMSEETKKERIAEFQKKEQEFQQLYFS